MGATRIVGAGLRLWSENWVPWFVVTLALTGVIAVVTAAVDPWSAVDGTTIWIGERPTYRPDPNALAVVLTLVSVFFLGPWELLITHERRPAGDVLRPTPGLCAARADDRPGCGRSCGSSSS